MKKNDDDDDDDMEKKISKLHNQTTLSNDVRTYCFSISSFTFS